MELLDGRKIRNKKIEELKNKVSKLDKKLGLVVIQVGNDEASNVYVKQKEKLALDIGYNFIYKKFSEDISNKKIIEYIKDLNKDDNINGIIVQLPLSKSLDTNLIINMIDPSKDVDGLTYINSGKLIQNSNALIPCTPKGIIDLLKEYNIEIEGKNVVIIGRSILVGKPLFNLFINNNATVTLCHSKSKDITYYTRNADIVVVAVGKKYFLKKDMIKENAIIIDVGINRENNKLYGDVDFDNVKDITSYITPVPGGVGPMTVYELMNNVYIAYKNKNNNML